ncbi:hypothetical protein FOMPIDRAFT_87468 [Fomitopsis schrenkii]|uniref:Uncharacterized protein n=1 Tax=Fomitopsis schrenkii TaxID=2126942 RepID=S8F098_FOMSC|nr:hypothetical protein FOMPIDRAFT_87468 [Fomitopsis schrenkii]
MARRSGGEYFDEHELDGRPGWGTGRGRGAARMFDDDAPHLEDVPGWDTASLVLPFGNGI